MISACIGFKDRDVKMLKMTIACLHAANISEVIVCNGGTKELGLGELAKEVHVPMGFWREGLTKNIAALHASGDTLLIVNGGIWISRSVIQDALKQLLRGDTFVCPAEHFYFCTKASSAGELTEAKLRVGAQRYDAPCGLGHFLMIDKLDYCAIGGQDSEMYGWGREDRDFYNRASKFLRPVAAKGAIYHLWDGFPIDRSQTDPTYQRNDAIMKRKQATDWWANSRRQL